MNRFSDNRRIETEPSGASGSRFASKGATWRTGRGAGLLKASAGRISGPRRLLALLCVLVLAVLQCFVVIPAFTGQAHAAADVDFKANYNHDFSVTQSNHTWITNAPTEKDIKIDYDTGEVDEEGNPIIETKTYKGRRLSTVLKNAKLKDNKSVRVNGKKIDNPTAAWLVEIDGVWVLYYQKQLSEAAVDTIEVNRGRDALKITEAKADKENPLKGDEVTISYSIDVDDFYKNSDEFKDHQDQILGLEWKSSSNRISPRTTRTNDREGSFTVKVEKAGDISIFVKSTYDYADLSYLGEGTEVAFKSKKPKLTVKPKTVKLEIGKYSDTLEAKDGAGNKIELSDLTWVSSDEKVAEVSNGAIHGVGKGDATITITSKAESSKGATATIKVKVVEQETTTTKSTTRYSGGGGYRPTYSGYHPITRSTSSTGAPTTATRPPLDYSTSNLSPSFQTITVKEVFLTPMSQETMEDDTIYYDEYGNPIEDESMDEEGWEDEEWDEEGDWDEDGVSIPAAAGSAAVAVAACGAGAVGRIRRFRIDMGPAVAAAIKGAAAAGGDGDDGNDKEGAKGKMKFLRGRGKAAGSVEGPAKAGSADAGAPKVTGADEKTTGKGETKSRNPLNKIRRKS